MLGTYISSLFRIRPNNFEEMCVGMKQNSIFPMSLKLLVFLLIFTILIAVVLTGNFVEYIPNSWIGVLEILVPQFGGFMSGKSVKNSYKDGAAPGQNLIIMNSNWRPRRDGDVVLSDYRSVTPVDFVSPYVGDTRVQPRYAPPDEEDELIMKHDTKLKEDKPNWNQESEAELIALLHAAVKLKENGKTGKAQKLFEHALALAPKHPDILTEFGLFHEDHSNNVVQAEELFTRALMYSPWHKTALLHRERTLPLVEEIDNKMLNIIDQKREFFLEIPRHSAPLRRAMREAYFQHVYHTVALEGNTMSLVQTRSILETRLAVGGKSVVEHNEILGMDEALRFINMSLVHRIGSITLQDIKEIHRRVLGYVDPFQAGVFRDHQVYVGGFTPVEAEKISEEMEEFIEWVNSDSALRIHPVELAALAHYKFVYIHPFIDGNGRTARLLMNLILMQAGFPPVIIRVEDRLRYYETLAAANEGDLRPFIRFIAAATDRTLDAYLEIVFKNKNKFSLERTDCILEGTGGNKYQVSKNCMREKWSEDEDDEENGRIIEDKKLGDDQRMHVPEIN